MAYTPNTLAYTKADMVGGLVPAIWLYQTTDADATIVGAGYFADGYAKGMQVGDLVYAVNATGPKYKLYQVSAVTVNGAATVTAPVAIT